MNIAAPCEPEGMKGRAVLFLFTFVIPGLAAAPEFRLGNQVEPVRYAANLTVTPGQDTFDGEIDIDVRLAAPADEIWLNASGLTIQSAELHAGDAVIPAKVQLKNDRFAGFSMQQTVPAGPARLHIRYSGKVSNKSSAGIFQLEEANRWYMYTQFEPTDARRAFPCFDEPGFKTPWQLTLNVPKELKAFANTPQVSETPQANGRKIVKFAQTRPLPSYLVAFAVGPFDVVDAGTAGRDHTRMRIITPHGKADQAKFAAATIPELLVLLEQYFGIPYPYDKLDSVVMPISNFAMENVGLITYSEHLLLADPADDTLTRQREMAIVAAHEMAHQWFGDLVTTAWWNDIWLNEGFATWMETKIVDEWKPEWRVNLTAVDDRIEAMGLDSLITARKVRQPIVTESDIANAFDNITYLKGAALLRMFENWIGPEVFRRGVHAYIQAHADKNATTADFLAAISGAAGKNIAPAFNTFLDQPGVPEISAGMRCDSGKPVLHVSQRRYLPIGSPGRTGDNTGSELWQIPVCFRYGGSGASGKTECELLTQASADLALRNGCPAWVVPNAGANGYYYSNPTITDGGKNLSLPELVSELADERAGVKSGAIKAASALALVPEFANHPERHVVNMDTDIADLTENDFMPAATWPRAAAFIDRSFGARARALGWEPRASDDDDERLLRRDLVRFVAAGGDDRELTQRAEELARRWFKEPKSIAAGTLSDVLQVAAEHGNRDLFNKLHAVAINLHDREQRQAAIRALGSFRDPAIARDAMALLLTNEFDIRESFYALLFGPLAYPETRSLPFEFVKAHLDELLKRLPREVGGDFAAQLPHVGSRFCNAAARDEVQNFFKDRVNDWIGAPRILAQTVERINICIGQRSVLAPDVTRFLSAR